MATPFTPASPPAVDVDVSHLFTESGKEINTEGLSLKSSAFHRTSQRLDGVGDQLNS